MNFLVKKGGRGKAKRTSTGAAAPPGMAAGFYRRLLDSWGGQNWWPAESKFEVVAGAILTQNTSWKNVEQAMRNLKDAGALSLDGICRIDIGELERLLRPAGYFRQKSRRLKDLAAYIANTATVRGAKLERQPARWRGLERMLAEPTAKLREELLRQKGVGPETADSILLYAGDHPVFVVDAYTRRIFERHQLVPADAGYEEIRLLVERELRATEQDNCPTSAPDDRRRYGPPSGADMVHPQPDSSRCPTFAERSEAKVGSPPPTTHLVSAVSGGTRGELAQRYNEFHALLVQVGKHYCLKSEPKCEECPLREFL